MTRERLEEIARRFDERGEIQHIADWREVVALARRGLEAEEALERCAASTLRMHELHRACELARECRLEVVGYIPDWAQAKYEMFKELDAALAAVGMPVEG